MLTTGEEDTFPPVPEDNDLSNQGATNMNYDIEIKPDSKNEVLFQELEESKKGNVGLQEELNALEKECAELQSSNKRLESKLASTAKESDELANLKKVHSSLKGEFYEVCEMCKDLKATVQQLNSSISSLEKNKTESEKEGNCITNFDSKRDSTYYRLQHHGR